MAVQRTVAVVKPGAFSRGALGPIIEQMECAGRIARLQLMWLHRGQAEEFYSEHCGKPFFAGLIDHAVSGPCVAAVLEGEDAIRRWREQCGPTDPKVLPRGTAVDGVRLIRQSFGTSLPDNAVHGSDCPEAAAREERALWR